MVEITASQDKTEATRREFILGDSETIRHDLGERGRSSFELTGHQLEEMVPQIAAEMMGDRETPPHVRVSIKGMSASVQINTKHWLVGDVEVNVVLENSQEQDGEIVTKEVKANPPKRRLINIQGEAEKWGKKLNTKLGTFVKDALGKQDIGTTGVKFQFTENDTLRIEVEDEERLEELEAQVVAPEMMEIISPPPPQPPEEPKIAPEPVVIDVIPKEVVQGKRVKTPKPSLKRPREAVPSHVPPSAKKVAEQEQSGPSEESLKDIVAREKEAFDEVVEGYLGGEISGEQFSQIVDVYAESLTGINRSMNFQIDPSLQRGEIADRYWTSNDKLAFLEKDLSEETTPLGRKIAVLEDYVEGLRGKTEDFAALKKHLHIEEKPGKKEEGKELGRTSMQIFIERLSERRENLEDAWLNLEEARRAEEGYRVHPRTVTGSTPASRRENYETSFGTALREQEQALFAFSKYLEKMMATKSPAEEPQLFERYREIGERLARLSQEREKAGETPEERMLFLKEYDRVLDDRLRVFIEISRQRGMELFPGKYETMMVTLPDGEEIEVKARTIKQQLDVPNASLVEVKYGGKKTKTVSLVEIETQEESAKEAIQAREELDKAGIPVAKKISRRTYKEYDEVWKAGVVKNAVLYPDLSRGGRNEVFDFDFLHLLKKNHGEDFKLPEPLREEGRRIVEDLLRFTQVAASGLGEEPKKRRYRISPEAVRFVIDPSKKTVDVVIYDLSAVLTPSGLPESVDWIRDNAIALGLISEEDWERLQEPMKKAA